MGKIAILLTVLFLAFLYFTPVKTAPAASKLAISPTPTVTPESTVTPTPKPRPTNKPVKLSKKLYKIALSGDSLVNEMRYYHPYLKEYLEAKYKGTSFEIYNYAQSSQNILWWRDRFYTPFPELGYPVLNQVYPDVIVVGSHAYNPIDFVVHLQVLTQIYNQSLQITPRTYLLAEICPIEDFTDGRMGWDAETKRNYVINLIRPLLDNVFKVGGKVIDTYHPTCGSDGWGKLDGNGVPIYTANDGVHPSDYGHSYVSKKIVDTIVLE